jgi:hypothetical protein
MSFILLLRNSILIAIRTNFSPADISSVCVNIEFFLEIAVNILSSNKEKTLLQKGYCPIGAP